MKSAYYRLIKYTAFCLPFTLVVLTLPSLTKTNYILSEMQEEAKSNLWFSFDNFK